MPSNPFLDRYQAGDRVQGLERADGLGKAVRHEIYLSDAQDVAAETMRRVRHNVELLISRLAGMGYRFRPPGDDEAKDFDSTMGRMGFHAGQSFGGWTCSLT
ncbi:MAG TPA: hypothetical protein VMH81_01270 [Bryobacteraceae bacterium]|nr:hypothetical protein [Bryobacteraceae bacterium]